MCVARRERDRGAQGKAHENWHRNHHAKPSSARFGWTFWQIDVGWYAIVMLETMGLAKAVKRPSE